MEEKEVKICSFPAKQYLLNMVSSSCQILQELFQTRWKMKTGKDWEHTEEQNKQFIEDEVGNVIYRKAQKIQKENIAKEMLGKWDISTLSMVLQTFGDQGEASFEKQNEGVRGLTRVRNVVSHRRDELSLDVYKVNVELFRTSLKTLQVSNEKIEKMIDTAWLKTSSVEALEATKKLYEMADEHLQTENFEKAIKCLDEAITTPSLHPVHQASAFEKRTETYLQLAHLNKQNQNRGDGDNCCEQAMRDATTALELNESSWKAHYLLGQCHRWQNNFELAIQNFHKAHAISPVQKQVKKELDACKILTGVQNGPEATGIFNIPIISLQEAMITTAVETGRKMTEEQFIKYKIEVEMKLCEGQVLVFRGHQYGQGWSVEQSDELAFRYFESAAKVGNIEGIFNLGLCYRSGKGVAQDLEKAYKLYVQAANMSPDTPGLMTKAGKNKGVASAQHCLGCMYEHGIVVGQDHFEAMMWYMKATENGNGASAYNLGLMFASPKGVTLDFKKAEIYWVKALKFEEPKAAESLFYYYMNQIEPEKAQAMFEAGKQLGSEGIDDITTEEFDYIMKQKISKRSKYEQAVIDYEKEQQLDAEEITFLERIARWSFRNDPKHGKFFEVLRSICSDSNCVGIAYVNADLFESDMKEIAVKAHAGSTTAKKVLETIERSFELINFILGSDYEDSFKCHRHVLRSLYDCFTLDFHIAVGFLRSISEVVEKLKIFINPLFLMKYDEWEDEDKVKIRLCYASISRYMGMSCDNTFIVELLIHGVILYPDNFHYYYLLQDAYGSMGDHDSGLLYAERGLEKFPNDPDLLFAKASHLYILLNKCDEDGKTKNSNRIKEGEDIAAYKHFLSIAPSDHKQCPEAYYTLAACCVAHLGVMPNLSYKSSVMSEMQLYYHLGKESEANMLPCYLPLEKSFHKKIVELALALLLVDKTIADVSPGTITTYPSPDIKKSPLQSSVALSSSSSPPPPYLFKWLRFVVQAKHFKHKRIEICSLIIIIIFLLINLADCLLSHVLNPNSARS